METAKDSLPNKAVMETAKESLPNKAVLEPDGEREKTIKVDEEPPPLERTESVFGRCLAILSIQMKSL